jgi:hypothetical protein
MGRLQRRFAHHRYLHSNITQFPCFNPHFPSPPTLKVLAHATYDFRPVYFFIICHLLFFELVRPRFSPSWHQHPPPHPLVTTIRPMRHSELFASEIESRSPAPLVVIASACPSVSPLHEFCAVRLRLHELFLGFQERYGCLLLRALTNFPAFAIKPGTNYRLTFF